MPLGPPVIHNTLAMICRALAEQRHPPSISRKGKRGLGLKPASPVVSPDQGRA